MSYRGPAVLVLPAGKVVDVEAQLYKGVGRDGIPTWSGAIETGEVDLFGLIGENLPLRLPDGRTGVLLLKRDRTVIAAPPHLYEVSGSTTAPF